MREILEWLGSSEYMPHGHCYLWQPGLVWAEVVSNLLIGLAYLSISITLAYLVRRVRDLPFQWAYLAFGLFIVTCGFTHFMDVWVIWHPTYWLDAAIRIVTAVASVGTAVLLFPLVPRAIALAGAARLAHERGIELTELNRELSALYEQTRATLAEAIPQLVWTTRPDGIVEYVNQRWIDYTGASGLGDSWLGAVHPDDRAMVRARWEESVRTGALYEIEYRLRGKDGAYRWFLGRGLPVRANGKIVRWFGTSTDVHEQKLLAEERARLLERAREEVRARDTFLAIAAHELKTPLTPLRFEVEGILRAVRAGRADLLEPERLDLRLSIVERQLGRIERLIANLLDVARVTSGRFELAREEVDLAALIEEIARRHAPELTAAGCALALDLEKPVIGSFDRLRLDEVVTNLLLNAVVYGRGKPIDVSLARVAGKVRLEVRDHGVGVAPEDQARIFERFERAASERHAGGLGLGLWLVQIHRGAAERLS
jgi:hypothetical protein